MCLKTVNKTLLEKQLLVKVNFLLFQNKAWGAQSLNSGISLQESNVYHNDWDFTGIPKTDETITKRSR
jgi:hypothetical protein